ncbi:MAG: TonB-dependent receptor [Gammaproteobacteria bacterium]|nr:TonB-dependent receptor [Gammaproteobacteria bacterium]
MVGYLRAVLMATLLVSCCVRVAVAGGAAEVPPRDEDDEDLSTVVVSSTRIPRMIGDEPIRVDALPEEEIAENSTVRPGDVTSLLAELSGVRFEASSAGLNATGLQLRGFPSRHALVLLDGLPLPPAATASFGLLQFPPVDLQQVEVIKGSANSLYGQDSLAGVLNLVSRPGRGKSVITTDLGSGGADNLTGFLRSEDPDFPELSMLLYRSHQTRRDIDQDGWTEIPGYLRYGARPRLALRSPDGRYVYLTLGATNENRIGGTTNGPEASAAEYPLKLDTRRQDAGIIARLSPSGTPALMLRATISKDRDIRQAGARKDDYAYRNEWLEVTQAGSITGHDWILGASVQRNRFEFVGRPDLEYSRKLASIFLEDSHQASDRWSLHASGRHEWGALQGRDSLRVAAMFRGDENWGVRLSVGRGEAMPSYALPELSDYGPGAIVLRSSLQKESAATSSLDIDLHPEDLQFVIGVFDGRIRRPLDVRRAKSGFEIFNRQGVLRFRGLEATIRFVEGPWHLTGAWTVLDSVLDEFGERTWLSQAPKNSGELAVLYEVPRVWRAGIEFSHSGSQQLDEPGHPRAPSSLEVSILAARSFDDLTLFINAMNLTDERQTKKFPLRRAPSDQFGMPVNEAWGSLSGRVVNVGLRLEF